MRCDEVREKLTEFTEHTLLPKDRDRVVEHLATCVQCRMEANDLAKAIHVIRTMPRKEPVTDLWEEFAPRFDAIRSGEDSTPQCSEDFSFARVVDAIREGWLIFANVVSISTRTKLQSLTRGTG